MHKLQRFYESTSISLSFSKFFWKSTSLYPQEKNLMFRVLHASCSDKPKMKQLHLLKHDNCTYCKLQQETVEHVLFECHILEYIRLDYNPISWKNIFVDRSSMSKDFATNVLIGAWENEVKKTIDYLHTTISRWSRTNNKAGYKPRQKLLHGYKRNCIGWKMVFLECSTAFWSFLLAFPL